MMGNDFHVRIEYSRGNCGDVSLGHSHVLRTEQKLTIQIRNIDCIQINYLSEAIVSTKNGKVKEFKAKTNVGPELADLNLTKPRES